MTICFNKKDVECDHSGIFNMASKPIDIHWITTSSPKIFQFDICGNLSILRSDKSYSNF